MDGQARPRTLSPPRLAREHASFSAALLDAIYRSIDTSHDKQINTKNSSPDKDRIPPAEFWRDPRAAPTDSSTLQKYPSTPRYQISSTTSTPQHRPPRPNKIQPNPSPPNSPSNKDTEHELIPSKNEKKKGKKKRSLIGLLKSLFSRKRDRKAKIRPTQPPQVISAAITEAREPISSSARSCMSSRRKSDGTKRSVRFATVSVIADVEECSTPCGRKYVFEGAMERRVDELIKALKTDEIRGRRKGSGSLVSELSELDSLVAAACEDRH